MKIDQLLEYIDEEIADAKSELKDSMRSGNGKSYGAGYEAGKRDSLYELKEFILENKD